MASQYTMSKVLGTREMGGILRLEENELGVRRNLLENLTRDEVKKVMKNISSGIKINIYDEARDETRTVRMKRVSTEEIFHIEWNIQGKGYVIGDQVSMYWDERNKRLAYKIFPTSSIRTNPEVAKNLATSSSSSSRG